MSDSNTHPEFELNDQGNVITNPVVGWKIMPAAEVSVFLALRYVESPRELETGGSKQVQLLLMPQMCLELAEALTRVAKRVLENPSDSARPAS
jgi:hypothetical protein